MKNIKERVETDLRKVEREKKQIISFTLSNETILRLTDEAKRLETNKSFLIEMILINYFDLPITKKEEDKKS